MSGPGSVFAPAPRVTRARLLAVDPDLGQGLDESQAERAAGALTVHLARVAPGDWQPRLTASAGALGLLVVDGLIVREIAYAGNHSAELLGSGDVLRPCDDQHESLLAPDVRWFTPEGASVAVLDPRLTAALSDWPAVGAALFDRTVRRVQTQMLLRSTSQLRRLDHRTLIYLWHAGERFGRMTPRGLAVRLPLTHARLAALVGAHRPSFTMSLRKLDRSGLLLRGDDHEFVLTGDAGSLVAEMGAGSAAMAA